MEMENGNGKTRMKMGKGLLQEAPKKKKENGKWKMEKGKQK